jgi:lipopolysaccharide export system protein LptC
MRAMEVILSLLVTCLVMYLMMNVHVHRQQTRRNAGSLNYTLCSDVDRRQLCGCS